MEECYSLPQTQSQGDYFESSQEPTTQELLLKTPWGRLSPCSPTFPSVDLFENNYTCGRAPDCEVMIQESHFSQFLNVSKKHFKITKEEDVVYITDLSKNGTFVNSCKVGSNKRQVISTSDLIALGTPRAKVFIFNYHLSPDENFLPQGLRKSYFISRLLGRGACGEVRLALDKKSCHQFAIKRIHKALSTSNINHPQKIRTEIEILKNFSHPFIINMREVIETESDVFLVLEYMNGGDLGGRIHTSLLSESEAKFIFHQILMALQYLHQNGVTHRDLKPENVLLSHGSYPRVKISDFGLSKVVNEITMMKTICGTIHYVAPEVLKNQGQYTQKVDVWSLGVMLFYMLSKTLPFTGPERENVGRNILKGKFEFSEKNWRGISGTAKDLIKKMLTLSQNKRISIDEIFEHPWIERDVSMQYRVNQLTVSGVEISEGEDSSLIVAPKRQRLY